jgi:hypothetical protein
MGGINWEELDRNQSWYTSVYYPDIFIEVLSKTMINMSRQLVSRPGLQPGAP